MSISTYPITNSLITTVRAAGPGDMRRREREGEREREREVATVRNRNKFADVVLLALRPPDWEPRVTLNTLTE